MRNAAAAIAAFSLLLAGCQGGDNPSPVTPTGNVVTVGETTSPVVPPSTGEPATTDVAPGETKSPPGSSGTDPSPSDAATPLPAWEDGPVEVDPAGESPVTGEDITGVRIATHTGFDRVVLDLSGAEPELGWTADFTQEAIGDPSGEPIEMNGDAFLNVSVRGINWLEDSPERYDGSGVSGDGTSVVTEVRFAALFEGQQQVLIGLSSRTAFRVFSLSDPARIVIDVQHP